MEYPFFDKVKEALAGKEESIEWLADQLGKTRRWIYDQSMEKLALENIIKISEVLEFNFLEDYNLWRQGQHQAPLFAGEPMVQYVKMPKKLNIDFRITTTLQNAEETSSKMLNSIRLACDKYGYDLELL